MLLENYILSNALEENGVTLDDYEMFNRVWQTFDVYFTQFIRVDQLSIFLSKLDKPFEVPKPNEQGLIFSFFFYKFVFIFIFHLNDLYSHFHIRFANNKRRFSSLFGRASCSY